MPIRTREEYAQLPSDSMEDEGVPPAGSDERAPKVARMDTRSLDENALTLQLIQQEDPTFDLRTLYHDIVRNKALRSSLSSDMCRRLFAVLHTRGLCHKMHMEVYDTPGTPSCIFLDILEGDALALLQQAGIEGRYTREFMTIGDQTNISAVVFVPDVPLKQFIKEFRIHYDITYMPVVAARIDYTNLTLDVFDPQMLDMSVYRF